MRNDIEQILRKCKSCGIEAYVLSNFLVLPSNIEDMLRDGLFTGLAFSIDSLEEEYNVYIRGHHKKVFENIYRIIGYKIENNINVEIGLYMVLTKLNYNKIIPLLDWAEDVGINYVSIQIVYLPEDHQYYKELIVDDKEWIREIYYQIQNKKFARKSSFVLSNLTDILLDNTNVYVESCFANQDKAFLFIDGEGNVSSCITKREMLGNITKQSISECLNRILVEDDICKSFSANCLGVWEILYTES